jgi:hypothetical protein
MPRPPNEETVRLRDILSKGPSKLNTVMSELASAAHPGKAYREGLRKLPSYPTVSPDDQSAIVRIGRRSLAYLAVQRAVRRGRAEIVERDGEQVIQNGLNPFTVFLHGSRRAQPYVARKIKKPWSKYVKERVIEGPVSYDQLIEDAARLVSDDAANEYLASTGRQGTIDAARRQLVYRTLSAFKISNRIVVTGDGDDRKVVLGSNPWKSN